jgi:hypothetical protein
MSTFRESGVNDLKEKACLPKCKRYLIFCAGLTLNKCKTVTKVFLVECYLI